MIRGEHSSHSIPLKFYSITNSFQDFIVFNVCLFELVQSIILVFQQWCVLAVILLWLSILLHYLAGSFSSLYTQRYIPHCRNLELFQYTILRDQIWHFLKESKIVRYSKSELIIFCSTVFILSNDFNSL